MRQYLLVATLMFLVSCGPSVDVTPLAGAPALAPKTRPAQVFTSAAAVTQPYREIALLTAEDGSQDERVAVLVEQATELGADGIILLSNETRSTGSTATAVGDSVVTFDSTTEVTRVSAFVYTE